MKDTTEKLKQWPAKHKKLSLAVGIIFVFIIFGVIGANSPTTVKSTATASKSSAHQPAPKITTAQVTETQSIPFTTTTQNDGALPKGQTKVIKAGQNGVSTLVYEVRGRFVTSRVPFSTLLACAERAQL